MKRRKWIWLLFSTVAVLLAMAGISYAWYVQSAAMTTLLEILPPDTITIIPISESDGSEMTELDLDFHEGSYDKKDDDGTIHILRPICIKSTSPVHRLEVVHTTNLESLKFEIYPATKSNNEYAFTTPISGGYKNQDPDTGLAKKEKLDNYKNTEDVADVHAYPLYWLAVNCAIEEKWQSGWQKVTSETEPGFDPVSKGETVFYCTYYILEISWKEETKETDLFYIMAQNVAVNDAE